MKRFFPPSFYNLVSFVGFAIVGISFGLILFLMLLEYMSGSPKPYMGIIAFVILPAFLLLGLGIAIVGIFRARRHALAGHPHGTHLPRIDLNNPRHRTAFVTVSLGTILFLLFSAFGSYEAYEHLDSDQFCGETCHSVMEPEYTAYQFSPHARVGCVKCHIGSGADWFVRSKLSGTYQLYAVAFNKYPRPIPTPIRNLRPAQETCEQCHWPKHFFSEKLVKNQYYLSDEKSTHWMIDLLIKIGGGNSEAGPTSGIHWHMNILNELTYVPADSTRQVIPWIRSRGPDGKVTVYRSTESTLTDEEIARGEMRKMDCIDCHNRPTHIYHPAPSSVNHVMSLGWINPKLPGVKGIAVKALDGSYATKQGGLDSIKLTIDQYFSTEHPDVAVSMKEDIKRCVEEVQKIYSRNYFPEMGVSWRRFPNNIGHMYYPGCFRCHDGKHVSGEGKVLSRDCNTCHTILAQQLQQDTLRVSLSGVEYRHPVDISDAWKDTNCSDCHAGN